MKRILPGMDRLIFIDDARYVNRQTEHDLAELLDSKYGGIKYTVYSADEIGIDQLLDSLSTVDVKRTGVLFSSWHYLKNMSGRNEIMTNPFKIIASSSVPLFSLRPTGLKSSGMIGGYVYDENEYSDRLIATVNAVLEGKQPRDIPFYTPRPSTTCLQLSGTAPAQHLPEHLPDEHSVFRQTGLVHGAV